MSETSEPATPAEGAKPPGRDLATALRTARLQQAERSEVIVDLRAAEIARLELLRDEVAAIMRQVPPEHAALFDGGLVPGFPPRLWIDILSFVEMGRDKRTYRFLRDGRQGRDTLAETAETSEMADKVMDYVAHRIIERERALSEEAGGTAARAVQQGTPRPALRPAAPPALPPAEAPAAVVFRPAPAQAPVAASAPVPNQPPAPAFAERPMAEPQPPRRGRPERMPDEWTRAEPARQPAAPPREPPAPAFATTGAQPTAAQPTAAAPTPQAGWATAQPGWSVDPLPQRRAAPDGDWARPRLGGQGEFRRRRRLRVTPFVTFLSGLLTGGVILGLAAWAIIGFGLGR